MADEQNTKNPGITSGVKNILIILGLLVLIGAAGFFLFFRKGENGGNKLADTADDIRRSFQQDAATSTNPGTAPQGGGFTAPTATPPAQPGAPSGTARPNNNTQTPSRPAVRPQVPAPVQRSAPVVFSNPALGLEMALPAGWSDTFKYEGNRVLFFDARSGKMAGYVEFYEAPQATLEDLEATLADNPSIQSLSRITVSGRPALRYQSGAENAIAVAGSGKVFYFHGGLATAEVAQRIRLAA